MNNKPEKLKGKEYEFDSFSNNEVLQGKKKGHLPAMGWNSWNAFGSGNTEALTKLMGDRMVELGLDKLGYRYVVLDDGCYKAVREDGCLANEDVKFPSGFKALSDYLHGIGLKFGMYNDIGTNLCAGAAVGTCGHELTDAKSYTDWGVDFIKVDNCYYLWDNATFSDAKNARFTFAPAISEISLSFGDKEMNFDAVKDGILYGEGARKEEGYVNHIGTFDGTGPDTAPNGMLSSELRFNIECDENYAASLKIKFKPGTEIGRGMWLQVKTGEGADGSLAYDDFLTDKEETDDFIWSEVIPVSFKKGNNILRLMNHRRQENTLNSYAALLEGFNEADKDHDVIISLCEWGKTHPHNWGYKVGDSWRILNDITFSVGSDGNPGNAAWTSDYTTSVMSQYNKAVVMDEYAGLDKGWNDPDMMMIGMNGLTETMCRTHMVMWCMMNSPLMLGLDLRRVSKGDEIYNIIANKDLIDLNQDILGVQAKRIMSTKAKENPSLEYIRDNDRADVLCKPLSDGSVALSFINCSDKLFEKSLSVSVDLIKKYIGNKMADDAFFKASEYETVNLVTKETKTVSGNVFEVSDIPAFDSVTLRICAK